MDVFWAKAFTKWVVCMPWVRAVAAVTGVAIREMIATMPAMTMPTTFFFLVNWFFISTRVWSPLSSYQGWDKLVGIKR